MEFCLSVVNKETCHHYKGEDPEKAIAFIDKHRDSPYELQLEIHIDGQVAVREFLYKLSAKMPLVD